VARVSGRGINVRGSDATIDRVALLDSPTLSTVQRFPGISVEAVCIDDDGGSTCDPATRASAVLTSSLVDRGQGVGVVVGGADATIKQVLVRDTFPNMDGLFGRGVQIQDQCGVYECEPPLPAHADIWATVVEGSTETGVAIISSTGVLEASEVRDTVASQFGFYGDGVVVFALTAPAAATLMSTRVAESARAGLASFGAQVALGGNAFVCHAFALNGELYNDQPYAFEDLGHNGCGCPDPDEPCKAVSSNLAPPPALEPAPSTGP
jgi:hypothetical protein